MHAEPPLRIVATIAPGHTVDEVTAAIADELKTLLAEGPSVAEVERARNNWQKSFFGRMERVAGRAGLLHNYNHFTGDPGFVKKDLDRYLAVTAESVKAWAGKVLLDDHRVEVLVEPGEGGAK